MDDFEAMKHQDDIWTLLQRYSATTVLTLLQEVANFRGTKIDWSGLAKKTSTGISNPMEYQMLWRHLAYGHSLLEKLDGEAEPLDGDSDLESEPQAAHAVDNESSAEVAACLKVLMASGLPSDTSVANNRIVEAPTTINVPNGQSSKALSESLQSPSSMHGTNISVPVSLHKRPLPKVTSAGGVDENLPQKKKRRPWTRAEDMALIAAVQKYGEGNWADMLKGDFKGDRTPSQLAQRWSFLKKQKKNLNIGSGNLTTAQLSEARIAAHHAMSLALDMPTKNLTSGIGNKQAPSQSQPASMLLKPSSIVKSVVPIKRSPPKQPAANSDSIGIKEAAMAAGARIATPADAASLMMAAQAKKSVHIIPAGAGSLIKRTISGAVVPNIHHIQTGLSNPSFSSQAMDTDLVKPTSNTVRSGPAMAIQQVGANTEPKEEKKVSEPDNVPKEQSQGDDSTHVSHNNPTSLQFESGNASQAHSVSRQQVNV